MQIRKNDTVMVIAGRDQGKKGKVRQVIQKDEKLLVDGVNIIKRHARATGQAKQAGIIEREAPIHASKLLLLCEKCGKPTRLGKRFLEDGKKVRYCKKCGEVID